MRSKDVLALGKAKVTIINNIPDLEYELHLTEVPYYFLDTSVAKFTSEDKDKFPEYHIATITTTDQSILAQISWSASSMLGAVLRFDSTDGKVYAKNVYADIYVEINPNRE